MDFTDPANFHDRTLLVEGTKFYVSSDLLSIHSEYFNSMFNGEFKEKEQEEIEIKDLKADEFGKFLNFFYPVRVDINKDNIANLIALSFRLLAWGALDRCRQFVFEKFDLLDKFDLLEVAIKYSLKDVKDKLSVYFGAVHKDVGHVTCTRGHYALARCQTCTCTAPTIENGYIFNYKSDIYAKKNRVIGLSTEAKSFILESILKNN